MMLPKFPSLQDRFPMDDVEFALFLQELSEYKEEMVSALQQRITDESVNGQNCLILNRSLEEREYIGMIKAFREVLEQCFQKVGV